MILKSFAKLNLYLEVLNLRHDRYHNIKTLFERIDLHDEITLKSRPDKLIKIICKSADVPGDNSNLAYRAAELLQDASKIKRGVDIKIIKRIPVGSGLAGGSSNAAGVLLGLNKLWKLNLSQGKLLSLARTIGSDVSFFIYNIPFALGYGRGDKIEPLKARPDLKLWHILVVPKIKVSTPLIYRKWDELGVKKAELTRLGDDVKITKLPGFLFNRLEEVTAKLYPEVKEIRKKLLSLGVEAISMSGSGPAVFGIVSSRKEALSLGRQLKRQGNFWQVVVTKTV